MNKLFFRILTISGLLLMVPAKVLAAEGTVTFEMLKPETALTAAQAALGKACVATQLGRQQLVARDHARRHQPERGPQQLDGALADDPGLELPERWVGQQSLGREQELARLVDRGRRRDPQQALFSWHRLAIGVDIDRLQHAEHAGHVFGGEAVRNVLHHAHKDQIVFAFDSTGSMTRTIHETKATILEMCDVLRALVAFGARVAAKSALVLNCLYWDARYPRLLPAAELRAGLAAGGDA
mgnify:CR=1 FL=1